MRHNLTALFLLGLTQSACITWRYETDPVPVVVQRSPRRLWVPVGADSNVVLMAPRIVNDTLTGLVEGSAPGGQALRRYAEPVSEVTRVATERPNTGFALRQGVAIAGIGLTLSLAAVILGGVR